MPERLAGGTGGVGSLMGLGGGLAEFFIEVSIARTDVTPKNFPNLLPAVVVPLRVEIAGLTVSNAGTTATLDVGKTGTVNFFVAAYDVKTAGSGDVAKAAPTKNATVAVGALIQPVAQYSETGAASSSGGPWIVRLFYKVPGV